MASMAFTHDHSHQYRLETNLPSTPHAHLTIIRHIRIEYLLFAPFIIRSAIFSSNIIHECNFERFVTNIKCHIRLSVEHTHTHILEIVNRMYNCHLVNVKRYREEVKSNDKQTNITTQ